MDENMNAVNQIDHLRGTLLGILLIDDVVIDEETLEDFKEHLIEFIDDVDVPERELKDYVMSCIQNACFTLKRIIEIAYKVELENQMMLEFDSDNGFVN